MKADEFVVEAGHMPGWQRLAGYPRTLVTDIEVALTAETRGLLVTRVVGTDEIAQGAIGGVALAKEILGYPAEKRGLVSLVISGYDEDPRDLCQIPEVSAFCRGFLAFRTKELVDAMFDDAGAIRATGGFPFAGLLSVVTFAFPAETIRCCDPTRNHKQIDCLAAGAIVRDLIARQEAARAQDPHGATVTLIRDIAYHPKARYGIGGPTNRMASPNSGKVN